MLHERIWAFAIETVAPGPQVVKVSLCTTVLLPGRVSACGLGSWLSFVYLPVPNAAELITGLNVDPGGFRLPPMVRLISGFPGAFSSALYVASTFAVSWPASAFGS